MKATATTAIKLAPIEPWLSSRVIPASAPGASVHPEYPLRFSGTLRVEPERVSSDVSRYGVFTSPIFGCAAIVIT